VLSAVETSNDLVPWAAGFFEGEGSITECGGRLRAQVKNTDFEVLTRFAEIVRVGVVYGPYTRSHPDGFRRKPAWLWVAEEYDALDALALLGPWLSRRRLERALELTGIRFDGTPPSDMSVST
jgi:hypothetical protein